MNHHMDIISLILYILRESERGARQCFIPSITMLGYIVVLHNRRKLKGLFYASRSLVFLFADKNT
jgi:hypothetical protein